MKKSPLPGTGGGAFDFSNRVIRGRASALFVVVLLFLSSRPLRVPLAPAAPSTVHLPSCRAAVRPRRAESPADALWPSAWRFRRRRIALRLRASGRTRCRPARPAPLRRCRPCGSRCAAGACSRRAATRSAARCVSNSLVTTSRSCRSCMTRRRAVQHVAVAARRPARPRLATVMIRSTNGRSSFAFGTVVVRCS